MDRLDFEAPITERERRHAQAVKPISMLSIEALGRLRRCVMSTTGPVLEIGTYIGGASILMGRALDDRGHGRLIGIEVGGQHLTHPDIPSTDVIADWRENVGDAGLARLPTLIEGYSWSPSVMAQLDEQLGQERVGLIVIDADGFPNLTLIDLQSFLAEDCLVVVDDYETTSEKTTVRPQIDLAVATGSLEEFGSIPYGTWFGRRKGPIDIYPLGLRFASTAGVGYAERVPSRANTEGWRFFEVGVGELERATPRDVMVRGGGCYSFSSGESGTSVVFAPSGNPSELAGRRFELRR